MDTERHHVPLLYVKLSMTRPVWIRLEPPQVGPISSSPGAPCNQEGNHKHESSHPHPRKRVARVVPLDRKSCREKKHTGKA